MDQTKRQQIGRLADRVREVCELVSPVDVEVAVERLGGTIVEDSALEFEAKIEKFENDGFRITLGSQSSENRKRFTVAHELGHLFLHMGYLTDKEKWDNIGEYVDSVHYRYGHSLEEYEAHEFAASFLMPREEFLEMAKRNYLNGNYHIQPIAEYFRVSREAVKTRGRWLGLFSWN